MTNDTPPNSFFSMVTGKSDQELHAEGDEGRSVVAGDSHTSDDQTSKAPNGGFEDQSVESNGLGLITESVRSSDSDMPHDARRVLVHLFR